MTKMSLNLQDASISTKEEGAIVENIAGFLIGKERLRKKFVITGQENVDTPTISADPNITGSTDKHETIINNKELIERQEGLPYSAYGEAVQETPGATVGTLTTVLFFLNVKRVCTEYKQIQMQEFPAISMLKNLKYRATPLHMKRCQVEVQKEYFWT